MVGLGVISHYLVTLELQVADYSFWNVLKGPDVTRLMSYVGGCPSRKCYFCEVAFDYYYHSFFLIIIDS